MQLTENTIKIIQKNLTNMFCKFLEKLLTVSKVKSDLQNSNWEGRSLGHQTVPYR